METDALTLAQEHLAEWGPQREAVGGHELAPFCRLPESLHWGWRSSPLKTPANPTSHRFGAHVLRQGRRNSSGHSLWFGCTLGAWVHHTAGWPSSVGRTGIPGIQMASSELFIRSLSIVFQDPHLPSLQPLQFPHPLMLVESP